MASNEEPTISTDSLWAGINNEQYYGDGYTMKPLFQQPPINVMNQKNLLRKWVKSVQNNVNNQQPNPTPTPTPTPTTQTGFDLQKFASENKVLIVGGLIALGLFFMSASGGGLAETTTVRRYNKK